MRLRLLSTIYAISGALIFLGPTSILRAEAFKTHEDALRYCDGVATVLFNNACLVNEMNRGSKNKKDEVSRKTVREIYEWYKSCLALTSPKEE